jgi:hypothetical protein
MLGVIARMKRPVSRRGLQIIAIVAMFGIGVVLFIRHFSPLNPQLQNMAAAERHIPILQAVLERDSRFTNLALRPYTSHDGSLKISGELYADADLQDLKKIVEASKPPVAVVYAVPVLPPEFRQQGTTRQRE